MKYYRVTYVPIGQRDKQWKVEKAENNKKLEENFKDGLIISYTEISKENYEEINED